MANDPLAGLIVWMAVSAIPVLVGLNFGVDQVVNAKMWEASESICKENGGVLEVVADSFYWVAHCGNGVSKEFFIK